MTATDLQQLRDATPRDRGVEIMKFAEILRDVC